uniref:Lipase domain-containing protein n=1 Tax=Timema shepardi TaxID=629360 RepID=A0A7R9B0C8_TIMSH|nr:unnamed protein product [Timema shepardi]
MKWWIIAAIAEDYSDYLGSGSAANVMMVDWSRGSSDINYVVVKGYVLGVGERVGEMVDFLVTQGLSLSDVHLVRHSLGAHVAGVAGNRIKSGKVGRITGALATIDYHEASKCIVHSESQVKWGTIKKPFGLSVPLRLDAPEVLMNLRSVTLVLFCCCEQGLDPAAPLFGSESLDDRLDSSDASFVEVIHTCGGLLGWAGLTL